MKKFLIVLLTIIVTFLLVVLGISMSTEKLFISIVEEVAKEELKESLIDIIKENTTYTETEIKEKLESAYKNNESLNKIVENYFDVFMNLLNNEEVSIEFNIEEQVENLIKDSDEILKSFNLTLTDEMKDRLLEFVSSSELNDVVNKELLSVRDELNPIAIKGLSIFKFLIGYMFKVILVSLIVLFVFLIALLKKSYYQWTLNFGISSLITGVLLGLLLPSFIDYVFVEVFEDSMRVNVLSLNIYGFSTIIIGILCITLNIVLSNKEKNSNNELEV